MTITKCYTHVISGASRRASSGHRMLKGHLLRWQPVQRLRQLGQFHSSVCDLAANGTVQASKAEKLVPAAPGTVKEYQQHILIQTAPLSSDSSAKELHSNHGCWWPSVIEKHPAVIEAVAAAAISQGNIKVSTYEESTRDTFLEAGRPVCDLRIYPAGVQYLDLPINKVFKCSHVGGHKYAGNVLVYGAMSPCDGDWFGGVNNSNAAEFLSGVLDAEVGSEGGAEEPGLRHLWRGRMGTTKQEQLDLFVGRTESDEDSSDADDVQNSGREALQAAHSSHIDATHASVNGAYELPQGLSCACQSADTLHTGTAHMRDAFARDYTSATVDMLAGGSSFESSDDDPDSMPPVQV
ncbi:hypothetical protein WJX82_002523 [Trebouxia sp. C0006]